jgi:phage major head subunit gpT-like protein
MPPSPLTPAILQAFFLQLDMRFTAAYKRRTSYWDKIAELVPSNTESTVQAWLAELPDMKEWVGEKVMDNIKARGYPLINKDWESTYTIDRNKISDDVAGIYARREELQADVAVRWPEKLITQAVLNGTTAFGYDGAHFFDTSHPVDVDDPSLGTYSNKLAALPMNLSNGAANYATAKAAMRKFKGESGIPLGVLPTVMMVAPDQEQAALTVAKAGNIAQIVKNVAATENVAAATPTNVYQGDITVIVNERLIDDPDVGAWYLLSTDRIRPFVFQQREAPHPIMIVDPQNPLVFNQKKFARSVEARGAAGYSLPFLAIKCLAV